MDVAEVAERHHLLTQWLLEAPYDARVYLQRAGFYEELGFYELTIGDAYKALLLTDEIQDEEGEYHERACDDTLEQTADGDAMDQIMHLTRTAYHMLVKGLVECGCLRSAYDFASRGLLVDPEDAALKELRKRIHSPTLETASPASVEEVDKLSKRSFIPAMLYPWNTYERDRFSPESLEHLKSALDNVAPKLEARAADLPLLSLSSDATESGEAPKTVRQLGLFAKADIAPGELVLQERSLLTACLPADKPICDCCGAELPLVAAANGFTGDSAARGYACTDCEDAVFCSEACQILATETYHREVCDKLVETVARATPSTEAADALYLLLLTRAFAMAQARQGHILDLDEVRFLWGDFAPERLSSKVTGCSVAKRLPFSFEYNILYPLNILEKMDVDVYATSGLYDFWVLNTVYAKFRAVANGSVDPQTGRPEVCAVHPLWSLANHSCAPNVRWVWGSEIKLWARRDDEMVPYGGKKQTRLGGVTAGDEIVNHYCDVELDVKARREWMMGTLGGQCMCERCKSESESLPKEPV